MGAPIYLPQQQTTQMGVAQGLAGAFESYGKQKAQQADAEALRATLQGIDSSPDRGSALSIVSAASGRIKDPAKISLLFHSVDQKHPLTDDTPIEAAAYDPVTGNEQKFFVKRSEVGKLKDPQFLASVTNTAPGQLGMSKPAKTFEYVDSGTGHSLGTFVPGMQPQDKNLVTKDDFERTRQLAADQRAVGATDRATQAGDRATKAGERADKRLADSEARQGRDDSVKNVSAEQSKFASNIYKDAATKYGLTLKADGSIDMAGLTGPQRTDVQARMDKGLAIIEDGGGKVPWGKAWREVNKNAAAVSPKAATVVKTVSTAAEFDALDPGAEYIDQRDGQKKRKAK